MVSFVVRTRGNIPVVPEMRSVFHEVAPGIALDNFQTMQEAVEKNTFSQRLVLYLVGSFAGLAIAMVVAGLYGVLSQLVSYRRREIGVRMALGATRGSVAGLVLRQGVDPHRRWSRRWPAAGICRRPPDRRLPLPGEASRRLDVCRRSRSCFRSIGLTAALLPARRAASIQPMQASAKSEAAQFVQRTPVGFSSQPSSIGLQRKLQRPCREAKLQRYARP